MSDILKRVMSVTWGLLLDVYGVCVALIEAYPHGAFALILALILALVL